MKISEQSMDYLINELKLHEGCKVNSSGEHIVYTCPAGYKTIGYGHNLDANPLSVGTVISEEKALAVLQDDIKDAMKQVDRTFPWAKGLDEARYTALVNMCFNLGISTLKTFKKSLGLLQEHLFADSAAAFAKSKWYTQVGNRAETLCQRIETGKFK